MRKSSQLDSLISRPVQEILAACLLERIEPWYLSDLAKRLGRTPSTLQRPLESLVSAGILRRRSEGNRVYFEREPDCPILPEIEGLLKKTAGLMDVLRATLGKFSKKISVAFVYGSIARGSELSASDVDLMLIGYLSLAEISSSLNAAERKLGRQVNAVILAPQEFAKKFAAKNHFLQSVLTREKLFLWGNENDLDELTGPEESRPARHKHGGAR